MYFKSAKSKILKPFNSAIHQVLAPLESLPCSVPHCQHPGQYGMWKTSKVIMRVFCEHHIAK